VGEKEGEDGAAGQAAAMWSKSLCYHRSLGCALSTMCSWRCRGSRSGAGESSGRESSSSESSSGGSSSSGSNSGGEVQAPPPVGLCARGDVGAARQAAVSRAATDRAAVVRSKSHCLLGYALCAEHSAFVEM
jgi:hypothetical protein